MKVRYLKKRWLRLVLVDISSLAVVWHMAVWQVDRPPRAMGSHTFRKPVQSEGAVLCPVAGVSRAP